ncbi:MAG TPA: prepilin-type N-terminal cleavage/methylation domain-containing protein [Candidatus Saccharimonadales bacterium]|nr:prepilin-type N-terminal cleavage/methylation domain-containing protein [Candidatus Saccharimonadales bacterium]
MRTQDNQAGFTIVELSVAVVIIGMIVISTMGLYLSLVQSATHTERKAVALTLATNQIEYLKSLPYNNLAVAGGSIISSNPLPATATQTLNGVKYTVHTDIDYVDDSYDGCGSYPNQQFKQTYCRNYPPPSGAPSTDLNPADYKDLRVFVTDPTGSTLASVDTQVSARVAETASNTGALFVKVIDGNGNPISGATVEAKNSSVVPAVDVTDSTDTNGEAIFYDLTPDTTGYHYVVTGSLTGYSTLTTIAPSGSLQPNYSSQQLISQRSSNVTLTLYPQGVSSLLLETTGVNGSPLASAKVYVKGGYKKYTATTDTQYYYDTLSPSDTRPVTDGSGLAALSNLVPGPYIFCGDSGATSCSVGGTTYYLAAAVPYSGSNSFNPVTVPTFLAASPPATTFPYNGNNYLQKVRLMLTTNSNYPRVYSLTPSDASQASGGLNAFAFQIAGTNLPCTASGSGCGTSVKFIQGASTFTASCTGAAAGTSLNCTVDISAAALGQLQLQISSGGNTLTLPGSPLLGGINVGP